MSDPAHPSTGVSARQRGWVVATVMLGSISTILATTIVNVAFPALLREFKVGHDSLQWVATGFLAATTTTMLATAWLVESFGQRRTFVGVLLVFLAASLVGAAAWSIESLIAARVLQGAAAGVMQPLAMIALFDVFPPERRGRAMGIFGLGIVLAPAIGPSVGGVLVQWFGWRSIFLLSVPFCVAALVLGQRTLRVRSGNAKRHRFDWIGLVLLASALGALLNVPVITHRAGWVSAASAITIGATAALVIAFIVWEFRAASPLLALRLFESRSFRSAALVAFAYGLGLFGTTYLIPVFVQDVAHYTPSRAGLLLLVPGIVLGIIMVGAGHLTDRTEPRRIVATGLACFALSSALLALSNGETTFLLLVLWLVIGRAGLGMIIPALNVGAVQALDAKFIAHAAASVNFARQLGGAIGVNLLAVLLEWRLASESGPGGEATAFQECFWVVTIAFAAAILPALSIQRHALNR
jgi:MFS transporter, DHA2 family, multidrug resistance protein